MMKNGIGRRLSIGTLVGQAGLALILLLSLLAINRQVDQDVELRLTTVVDLADKTVQHFHKMETDGLLTREQAQTQALAALKTLRYSGNEYFFVHDMTPVMVMHPTKPELDGKPIGDMKDPNGVPIFARMLDIVKKDKQGFLHYSWPKPGKDSPQPKLSYVRGFAPWGWVVGSGLYLDDIRALFWRQAGLLVGLALVIFAVAFYVSRRMTASVSQPLMALTERMGTLAQGDNASPIPGQDRDDELAGMAGALAVFRDAALAKQQADAEQHKVVTTLSACLAEAAKGNLARDIKERFPPSYAALRDDYNAAMASLRALIGSIATATGALQTGASEIAQASEDLARRSESNAASLEQTSAALAQMNERLGAAATSARDTEQHMVTARGLVRNGRENAHTAVTAMGRVAESAKGIDSVIEGVDKIAFQTRVLAMNAAVEAGRAGEAGKGFAVVADLVSALAMRAEAEAHTAREQLTTTQSEITEAVAAVQKVDGSFVDIAESTRNAAQLVERMAEQNSSQAATINEITGAVGAMDRTTQQNAAMVEQTSAAARGLATEVTALAGRAAQFRTVA